MKIVPLGIALLVCVGVPELARGDSPRPGGLVDGLTPEGKMTSDRRTEQHPETIGPSPRPPGTKVQPAATPAPIDDTLDAWIEQLKKRIADLSAKTRNDIPVVPDTSALEQRLAILRAHREREAKRLAEDERRQRDDLKKRREGFRARWAKWSEALERGQKPADVPAIEWGRKWDAYRLEKIDLEGAGPDLERRLKNAGEGLTKLDQMIAAGEERVKRLKAAGDEAAARERAWREHRAELTRLKARLAELELYKAERANTDTGRNDAVRKAAFEDTSDWFLAMDWLAKLITSSGRSGPPSPETLSGATSLLGWMKSGTYTLLDQQRAKVAWISRSLATTERALRNAESDLHAADRSELRILEDRLAREDHDPVRGRPDPATAGKRRAAVEKRKRELAATRADRLAKRRAELSAHVKAWRQLLDAERKRLDDLVRAAAPKPPPATP